MTNEPAILIPLSDFRLFLEVAQRDADNINSMLATYQLDENELFHSRDDREEIEAGNALLDELMTLIQKYVI